MMTLFSLPKPWEGHIKTIQRNALKSWTLLSPRPEIILFGGESGTAAHCASLGVMSVPEVKRNSYGTPLVNDVFEQAQAKAAHDQMLCVNTDIVLFGDFVETLEMTKRLVRTPNILMIGRRWDIDIQDPINFDDEYWETNLRLRVAREGRQHGEWGIDYFAFPRGLWKNIPPFAWGRLAWDNWLVADALAQGIPVIDATAVLTVVHQNHDRSHYNGGLRNPEVRANYALMKHKLAGTKQATYKLTMPSFCPNS